jgi:RNA polymerase sigma-70 factor (ECF subfamily)
VDRWRAPGAEEVVRDVLTTLWRNPAAFDPARGSLRAYLGVQAHRRAVDAVRTDVRRRAREERPEVIDLLASSCNYDELDRATTAAVIHQAIGRLPPEQRRAVELAFWAGYTHHEVAEALGIPEGAAKSRLRLAQAKLGQLLASFNLETV